MARILVYTSPARGHLFPLVPTLQELARRGHTVSVRTLSSEVERVRTLGFGAEPIEAAVEGRELDDWKAKSPPAALMRATQTFADRAVHEVDDLRRAIAAERPDFLYVDVNAWGACASAEASKLPWAMFAPYFQPVRAKGVPPYGLGLAPARGPLGALRDALLWPLVLFLYDRAAPKLNAVRAKAGVPPLAGLSELHAHAPAVITYTAEPLEYPRAWPANFKLVGPGLWEPPSEAAPRQDDPRPLVLVTCSTEFQDDARLIETALAAVAQMPVRAVVTTASLDPARFTAPPNARVERFVPHGPLLAEAALVVCHGGMGITQKALSAGVPVCVVPFGRDQLEVARHVELCGAGTRLPASALSVAKLRAAMERAMSLKAGAEAVAEAFRKSGGAAAAADVVEGLLQHAGRKEDRDRVA